MRDGATPVPLTKARWPVLGLAVFMCAGIVTYLSGYSGAILAPGLEAGAVAAGGALGALWLVRSARLAVVAAAVPITVGILTLGLLVPVAIAVPSLCGMIIPHAIAATLLPVTGIVLVILHFFVRDVCAGSEPDAAAWASARAVRRPALMALAASVLWRAPLLLPEEVLRLPGRAVRSMDVSFLSSAATVFFAWIVCLVLLPLALGAIRSSEDGIAKANRLRERRERRISGLGFITIPRWAMSLTGIAIVFTTLALFGGSAASPPASEIWRSGGLLLPATILVVGLIGGTGTRDWRSLVACGIPAALTATWGAALPAWPTHALVALSQQAGFPEIAMSAVSCATGAATAGFSFLIAARIASYRAFNDPLHVAFARTLNDVAAPLVAIVVASSLALLPLGLSLLPALCGLTAIVLTPALIAVVELGFPKLKGVEELYGKKRTDPN